LPIDEGIFLPQRDKTRNPQTTVGIKHPKPYTRRLWINLITAGDRRSYPIGLTQQREVDCSL